MVAGDENDPSTDAHDTMSFFGEHAFTAMKSSEAEMQDSSGSAADSDKKVIPDVPSEVMTKGVRQEWVRKTKRALTTEQETVREGGVPAKLKAETVAFDVSRLGARPPDSAVHQHLRALRDVPERRDRGVPRTRDGLPRPDGERRRGLR